MESIELNFSKKRILLISLIASFLFLTYAKSHLLASVAVNLSDYVEIQPNLYVDDMFTDEEKNKQLLLILKLDKELLVLMESWNRIQLLLFRRILIEPRNTALNSRCQVPLTRSLGANIFR